MIGRGWAWLRRLGRGAGTPPPQGDAATRLRLDKLRAQRDDLRAQRDRARQEQAELRASLVDATAALAEAGGRFARIDNHAGEAERRALAPALAARAAAGETLASRDAELLLERVVPAYLQGVAPSQPPPADLAFAVVANALYLPGLEALIRSLHAVYPGLANDLHIFHDGSVGDFSQRQLRAIHPAIRFHVPNMGWLDLLPDDAPNHRRVGRLGYMNVHALGLAGYGRVLVLDADLLVLGDIGRLWRGDGVIVVADCGDRPYAVQSPFTGDIVFNSGVISLPGAMLGADALAAMIETARRDAARPVCPTLDRFADQKVWNIHLKHVPKDYAPLNFNCNVRYLAGALGGRAESVAVLHATGAKPWIDADFLPADLVAAVGRQAPPHPRFWRDRVLRQRLEGRLAAYHAGIHGRRSSPRHPDARTCRIIAADPARVLPPDAAEERITGADFVLAGGDPAVVDHLVLPQALFGGWTCQHPIWPAELLDRLMACPTPPALWVPFALRELFEAHDHGGLEINYLLIEPPFRRFVDEVGRYDPDPDGFVDDLRDELLTLALPAAVAMGLTTIVAPALPATADARVADAAALAAAGLAARGVTLCRGGPDQ